MIDPRNPTFAELDRDGAIEEAAAKAGVTRSRFLRLSAFAGGGLIVGGIPVAFSRAQGTSKGDVDILNYALTLEYLEAAFYLEARDSGALSGKYQTFAEVVYEHEKAHVDALKKALGSAAVAEPKFDFKGTTGEQKLFADTAKVLEDTGVRAYQGQAGNIESKDILDRSDLDPPDRGAPRGVDRQHHRRRRWDRLPLRRRSTRPRTWRRSSLRSHPPASSSRSPARRRRRLRRARPASPASSVRSFLAGVAAVLLFVPLGWVASAALFGGEDGNAGARPSGVKAERFRAREALAASGRFTLAAHVKGDKVRTFKHAGERKGSKVLEARVLDGRKLPLVLLVTKRRADWVKVQLPTRPNLSEAWVHERDVRLRHNEWRLRIDLSAYRVYTYRGDRLISEHTIGVGQSVTPTPHGRYYLTDLVQPEDPTGLYGSFAFGLSAHSDVVTSFGAGDGQIGIHGTNDTSTLQSQVSHGCIRVGNSVIESFARHLPLGTPVRITA